MAKPALMVVNGDPDTLAALEQALQRRFGADYQVVAAAAPAAALATLGRLRGTGEQVALLLAEQWLQGMTGVELLCQAHALHPAAQRVLLIPYGDVAAGVAGLQAMALGQLVHWLNTPWGSPGLQLYPTVSELLGQWAKTTVRAGTQPERVRVVGPRWSPRSHELRDLLGRNNIAHGFYDADSEDGRRLLAQAGLEPTDQPVLLLSDGRVLVDPPPSGWPRRLAPRPSLPPAATTSPWSAPVQRAWPRPPTPPPKGYTPCCWNARRSAAKPAPPR
jgi:thioredoxin reductase (NADPH)